MIIKLLWGWIFSASILSNRGQRIQIKFLKGRVFFSARIVSNNDLTLTKVNYNRYFQKRNGGTKSSYWKVRFLCRVLIPLLTLQQFIHLSLTKADGSIHISSFLFYQVIERSGFFAKTLRCCKADPITSAHTAWWMTSAGSIFDNMSNTDKNKYKI